MKAPNHTSSWKKFAAYMVGMVALVSVMFLGLTDNQLGQFMLGFSVLVGGFMGGQAAADFGKSKALIENPPVAPPADDEEKEERI